MAKRIELPKATRELLAELARQRDEAVTRLELAVATVRATLGVPETYVLRTLEEGFVAPEEEETKIPGQMTSRG